MYNREKYLRRRQRKEFLLKGPEQYRAFDIIRRKWDLDDRTISDLLNENTVTEILEGRYENGKFRPKDLINLRGLLAIIAIVVSLLVYSHSFAIPEQKLAISPETIQP